MVRYKIVLIGNSGAGKTSIIERYSKSTFSSSYQVLIHKGRRPLDPNSLQRI